MPSRSARANHRALPATEQPGTLRFVSDRAVQDEVIRALADAPYRASAEWRARGLADPTRVERFARFLSRHFYYERVVQFFKYSRALARVTGRPPETILSQPGFEELFPRMVLGSRETATEVARLVSEYVGGAGTASVPYLRDLLRYEAAMMVAEAGPRVWRDGEGAGSPKGRGGERSAPVMVVGTVVLDLSYDLPAVFPRLLAPWTDVPEASARPVKLLVARSAHGRVAVARSSDAVERILAQADGRRTLAELFDGRRQLLVQHFMLAPGWEQGCPSCSFLADHFDGTLPHLNHHDVTLIAASNAPLSKIEAYRKRMGWHFPWVSSHRNDFNHDFHVSFTSAEMAGDKVFYNFTEIATKDAHEELPGLSAFTMFCVIS